MRRTIAPRAFCSINVTAIAGLLLLLLALAGVFLSKPNWPSPHTLVNLPRVQHAKLLPEGIPENAVYIEVRRAGSVFIGPAKVRTEELPRLIREHLSSGARQKAYITVDGRTKYDDVEAVLNAVRSAGIEDVTFLTR